MSWGFNLTSCQIGLAITSCVHRGGSGLVGLFEGKGVVECWSTDLFVVPVAL